MIREKWYISKKYKNLSMEILQDNLSALRARADITQEELANILGISRQTYNAIECKKKQMSWNVFMSAIFFFHEVKTTSEMLIELKIYPIDLILKFNGVRRTNFD